MQPETDPLHYSPEDPRQQKYADLDRYRREYLRDQLIVAYDLLDEQYHNQICLCALIANLALEARYNCGLYKLPNEQIQDKSWRYVLVADLPAGQFTYLLHDVHLPSFRALPLYKGEYQGLRPLTAQRSLLLQPGCRQMLLCQRTVQIPRVGPDGRYRSGESWGLPEE